MFQKELHSRTSIDDRRLAAYLAVLAGNVNSAGFVILGSFTSHVTGNVGRLADHVIAGRGTALLVGATLVAFFGGALLTSMLAESHFLGSRSRSSGVLLTLEAVLVAAFVWFAQKNPTATDGVREAEAVLLSGAMGIQNGLVTGLSGAIVRTTHLTGVVTDLGIEIARWLRWWRSELGRRWGVKLTLGKAPATRPHPPKIALLATIFFAFATGSATGTTLALSYGALGLVPVIALLASGAVYALWSGASVVRRSRDVHPS